jgi:hypothetical protein
VPRILLCFAAIAAFALPCRAEQTGFASETLIRLNVMPAPAPKPALRYQLLPELKEMHPGNPIQHYMKTMMEQVFCFDDEAFHRRKKLLTEPLKELPVQELPEYGRYVLSQADRAARLDTPDWQILLDLRRDGINARLPDVFQLRPLARALTVRFRTEVALGQFDNAIRTAKTMFAMSRHLGDHPTFIGNLVGIAIANLAIGPLEEMLEQQWCPNLYWALTNLPSPLVCLEKGAQGERMWTTWVFHDLDDSAPMTRDRLEGFIAQMDLLLGGGKPPKQGTGPVRTWVDERTKDEGVVGAARARLVEHGLSEVRLCRFPADQVILRDEIREFEVRFDDAIKTVRLPVWQLEASGALTKPAPKPTLFAEFFLPAVAQVRWAQARLDQRIALLRHVEALRLYAAEHNCALPAKLSEIPVPLPDDPVTGKPFRYQVIGTTAHLHGSPPPGMAKETAFNVHYELTIHQ